MKPRWEILILPQHRGEAKRFVLTRFQVVVGVGVLGFIGIAALLGFALFGQWVILQTRILALQRERDGLWAQVQRVQKMEKELAQLREFRKRVGNILLPDHVPTASPSSAPSTDQKPPEPSLPTPMFKDPFRPMGLPTRGYLSRGFSRKHPGLDLSAPYGTPVVATAQGRVHAVREDPVYGKVVEISHGKRWKTVFAHLQSAVVSPGDTVYRGQVIGFVGSTGVSTGPHLHYEIYEGGTPLDPLLFVGSDTAFFRPSL